MSMILAPSLLSADFGNLDRDIEMLNRSEADWIHVDVMDGVFVPNISFGTPIMQVLQEKSKKPLDVHLMIVEPEKWIERFKEVGADILNVHYEACRHLNRTLNAIRDQHMKAAVTLNPHTPVEVLEDSLEDVDMVLLMSVNPGYGGQKFIERTYDKVERLAAMRQRQGLNFLIEIDGGVNLENAPALLEKGADALVAGSSVFGAPDAEKRIQEFKRL